MQPFFQWLLRSTVQAGLIVCLILLLQAVFRNKLGVRWHHALWLILVIRMVLPWTPQSRLSVFNVVAWWDQPHGSHSSPMEPSDPPPATGSPQSLANQSAGSGAATNPDGQPKNIDRVPQGSQKSEGAALHPTRRTRNVLPLVWLMGALALGAYVVVSNAKLWRATSIEHPSTDKDVLELLEECRARMGLRTIVALVTSEKVNTPVLLGFIRPRLLIPRDIAKQLGQEELRYVFLHELAHVKRHDIALAWLTALLQVLHWFNPLVWLAFHRMRCDRELACDALVLTRTQGEGTKDYGRAIVSLLEHFSFPPPLPGLAGILENKSQLKRRIAMITQFKNNSYRWSVAGLGIVAVLGIIAMTDAPRAAVLASSAPSSKSGVTMRLVERNITGYSSVSPDGKYLCDVDIPGEDIVIREFATGEKHTLKPRKNAPDESGPVSPVISPDGKTIAYGTERPKAHLRLIGTDGSGQRDLCSGVGPVQWFPDGGRILGVQWPVQWPSKDSMISIVSVSVSDGSIHKIKTASAGPGATGTKVSPDGKYVAYGLPFVPGKQDIFVVEMASGQETPLVQHPADDRLLGWTPDGRYVLFASDRMGAWDAWLLPVAEGKAQGEPELVARNLGAVEPKGFTQNGSYYYEVAYNGVNVYTAAIDVVAGQLLSAPAALPAAGTNGYADWSPDGQSLAYCSYPEPSRQPHVIRVRSLATGQERELLPKLPMVRCLRWSPDGHSLLVSWLTVFEAGKEKLPRRVCRVDVDTGDSTVLLEAAESSVWRAELSPDGKTLYYSQGFAVFRRQIAGGEQKSIFDFPKKAQGGWITWALSPNGEFIAVGFNEPTKEAKEYVTSIVVVPSGGGEITELLRRNEPGGQLSAVAWSRDSTTVLTTVQRDFDTIEFWQVPPKGGQPRKITEAKLGWCYSLRVHPDGQRIAFSAGKRIHELWVMENFLPAGTGAKDSK
jgi:beta-lactamase regulating signal transducer with metallopeptidase domain/WD40 repeat protein